MIYADAQNPAPDGGLEISFVEVGRNCISISVVHHRLEMSQASVQQLHLAMYADKQQYTTAGHTQLPG